LHHRVPH